MESHNPAKTTNQITIIFLLLLVYSLLTTIIITIFQTTNTTIRYAEAGDQGGKPGDRIPRLESLESSRIILRWTAGEQ